MSATEQPGVLYVLQILGKNDHGFPVSRVQLKTAPPTPLWTMINGEQDLEPISSFPHAPEFLDVTSTDGSGFMMERSPKLKCTTMRCACTSYQLFVRDNIYRLLWATIYKTQCVINAQSSVLSTIPRYMISAQTCYHILLNQFSFRLPPILLWHVFKFSVGN